MARLDEVTAFLDGLLRVRELPDYPQALNGLQVENRGEVTRIAAAVDYSLRSIEGAVRERADLLLVHHGLFWAGAQPLRGPAYERLRRVFEHGLAVYSAHLPLDAHPDLGNNALLARELGLDASGGFARFQGAPIGLQGLCDLATAELVERARALARRHGGEVVATPFPSERRTRRWAVCTGAGASADTLAESRASGVDTLVAGEGPHWTAVDAIDQGLVVIYAGHYATETLGVGAVAQRVAERFGLPWSFVAAPTGL
jgi:dinuclear metal center YbgI/SA1388 family protein